MKKELDKDISYLDCLRSFELPADALIFVSSDIGIFARNMQWFGERFQADQFLEALKLLVPDGTVVIPAYTDDLVNGSTFDVSRSKPNTGALSNKALRHEGFKRTSDPLHSVLVWGKESERFLKCDDGSTFGPNSIFAVLHELNAYFIFIDIHIQECFTFIHYVEESEHVRYRRYYTYSINYIDESGKSKRNTKFYSKRLGVISDIRRLHAQMETNGDYFTLKYRDSKIDMLRAKLVYEKASHCISKGPALYTFSFVKLVKDFVKRYILRRKGIL